MRRHLSSLNMKILNDPSGNMMLQVPLKTRDPSHYGRILLQRANEKLWYLCRLVMGRGASYDDVEFTSETLDKIANYRVVHFLQPQTK